jgi:hypothetical protein
MKDSKKISELAYEDEYVFLTEENELYLKQDWEGKQKKLGEVGEEELHEKISELKEIFAELEAKVEERVADDEISLDVLNALENEIKVTDAVGDFGKLKEQVEQKKLEITQEETETKGHIEGETETKTDQDEFEEQAEQEVKTTDKEQKKTEIEAGKETEIVEEEAGEAEKKIKDDNTKVDREDESEDDPVTYYKKIVDKARDLAKQTDWSYVSQELDNLSQQWSEGPDLDSDKVKKLFQKVNNAVGKFQERQDEHYKELEEQKKENLETKKKLLEEFEGIISNKTWTATRRVNQMKGQWNSAGPLPSGKGEDLDERFEELLEIFNEHKVDRLVQKRQKEEDNLMLKLTVLEKMENLAKSIDHETENWEEIDEKFDDLTKQWKKIGRVPKEKSNEVWERYKSAQDEYYDRKYRYDPEHQSKVDKFYHKKEKLCEEAEALLEEEDIASAARDINKLHRRWKKVGNLPQRDEDKLWSRFKSATDAFNKRKAENQDKIEKQEEEHYQQKLELIDKANEIKDTNDFEKGHTKMQNFMDQWKEIGPVPRKKSDEIWKKFKGAMDEFYDRRREHFKEVKEKRKENLEKKQEILEKLRELGKHDDPIEAVDIAKDLQEKFKNVGYVPIKHKNKMWKQYREACDVIYDRMRAAKSGDKFDQELAKADLDPEDRGKIQKLRKEYNKIKKEAKKLEKQALQYKEKKTYFKPSNGGNSLLDEVENKIQNVEQKLEKKQQKMDSITDEMEKIRESSAG